jgi:transposase-like protein
LKPYQQMDYPVLATLSDGEKGIMAALKATWPEAPHQRCQAHFLNNLADPVLVHDAALRQGLRDAIGYVASPPEAMGEEENEAAPPFCVCETISLWHWRDS